MPSRSKIGEHIVFVLSVILSSCPHFWNFNLANNFWTVSVRVWYFTRIFLMIRPFRGYLILPLWPWPWSLTYFLKTLLTMLITFEQWVLELWYLTWVLSVARPFCVYHYFLHVTLTLEFDLSFKICNFANNFWTVSARALIFQMSISYDKTLHGYH